MGPRELLFTDVLPAYDALWEIGGRVVTAIGDRDDWLWTYRSGLRGMLARLLAVDRQYLQLHEHQERPLGADENPNWWGLECESYAGQIFFGMDSSLECSVFALNAIGFARDRTQFLDISRAEGLAAINPKNILGGRKNPPQPGYATYFPGVKAHWEAHRELIRRITDYHDVSKHRSAIATGGSVHVLHLQDQPRQPGARGSSPDHTLQSIAVDYQEFMVGLLPIMVTDVVAAFGIAWSWRPLASTAAA